MTITTRLKILLLSFLALTSSAHASVNVVRYPSGTPVLVCQPSDTNPSCAGGGGGSGTITKVGDISSGEAATASFPISFAYFKNATSGTVKFQTVTGALGTKTISLPAETGTVCTTGSVCSGYQASGSYLTAVTADTPLSGSGTSGSHLVIANAAADGSTKGAASFTANDFDASSGNISIDYTNGQASSASNKGFLTSTDWSTFNTKQTSLSLLPGPYVDGKACTYASAGTLLNCNTTLPTGTVTSVGLSSSNSTLTIGSTPVTTSGTITADINLGHANTWTADQTFSAANIPTDTTTGMKIATATNQKVGFFNATPVVQQGATTDLGVALSNLGLRASGTAYPITTSGAVNLTGGLTVATTNATITDVNLVLGTTTGTKFGTATSQKIGFYNVTPIVQPSGDVCTALQNLGLVTSCTEAAIAAPATLTGSTDAVQLTVKGNATQTNNIYAIQNSAATNLYTVDNTGNSVLLGTQTTGGTGQSTIGYGLVVNSTNASTASGGDFVFKNSAGTSTVTFNATGSHEVFSGTAPALTSCGTSPSVVGNDNGFEITVGSTTTACTATFAVAYASAPVCTVTEQTTSITNALSYTISASAVVLSQTALGGNKLDVICRGR